MHKAVEVLASVTRILSVEFLIRRNFPQHFVCFDGVFDGAFTFATRAVHFLIWERILRLKMTQILKVSLEQPQPEESVNILRTSSQLLTVGVIGKL